MLELNKLYNMDCMEGMKEVPCKYFDLAIVDPPYGIGISKHKEIGYNGFNKFIPKEWDSQKPDSNYFKELKRVSANQIIWGGNYFGLYGTRCFIIWDKGEGFKNRTYAECEMAWTSFDSNAKIYKHDPLARGDYHGKIHPTQKPIALYKWLLKTYAKPDFKIIDTHAGSCSSVIAFLDYGCDWIAFEIDKDYYEAASKRIENQKMQLKLNYEVVSEN